MRIKQHEDIGLLKGLLFGFLVVVGTFPENEWSFSTGIDWPIHWVFNSIFENNFAIGEDIVFPHGPLAFLMYPLFQNILVATMATVFLKVLLVYNVYWVLERKEPFRWLFAFGIAYLISLFSGFNQLIFANIILLYCNYYNQKKIGYKLLAFLLTAFAFFIKSSIAILSGLVCFSFVLYYFIKYKDYKKTAVDVISIIGMLFFLWLSMFGTFSGLIHYTVGMFQLAKDNSSAVSFYPHNNWWVLTLFILIVVLLPFVKRTKKSTFFGVIMLLSYFALWKHGMAREDVSHVSDVLLYMMISFICLNLFDPVSSFKNSVFSVIALFLFVINMQNAIDYSPQRYTLFGVNNFTHFITDFSSLKAKFTEKSHNNIASNQLPKAILDSIGDEKVDIYPWDYTIIAANKLNWQPRIVIQSYASYTSWLDTRNAEHFKSAKAPAFIIWELTKKISNLNGSDFNSIDNRYLLNDEPFSMVEIIKNYQFFYADNKFLVLKRRIKPVNSNQSIIGKNNSTWGQWINVPEKTNSLLRVKLTFNKTLLQRLKRFFYKDEQFWIFLKLQNGAIHRYRIVPENAKDGIWINPYIYNTSEHHLIEKIMFQCSNQGIMTKEIDVEWDNIEFNDEPKCVSNFFNKTDLNSGQLKILSLNSFESPEYRNWNKLGEGQTSPMSYSGTKSNRINADQFSSAFHYPLDSIPFGDLRISADCWIKSPTYEYSGNISMIVSINDSTGGVMYNGIAVDGQLIDQTKWNNVMNFITYKHNKPNCTLGVYIWNISGKNAYIDDFRIMIDDLKD